MALTYTLKQKNLRLEKRTKEYVALNSLDGMTIGFNMAQDSYWTNELTSLNARLADSSTYNEYEGTFSATTQTFSFTEVKFYLIIRRKLYLRLSLLRYPIGFPR